MRALESDLLLGRSVTDMDRGFIIDWIGPGGELLASKRSRRARFRAPPDVAYVRARVTYVRQTPDGGEAFFAWTQPVFTDGRDKRSHDEP